MWFLLGGENKPNCRLERLAENTYELRFRTGEFFGVSSMQTIVAFAFVFRSADASLTGKTLEGGDIYHYLVDDFEFPIAADNPAVLEQSLVSFPEWAAAATIYEVNMRQYSEDSRFASFQNHLPRLKALGVDILWFMPINPIGVENRKGRLGSYYSIQDYTAVHPDYGTMEEFKALVDSCHAQGFRVILDWVANHTAWDHSWVTEHPDWYVRDDEGNLRAPFDWTDVLELDYEKPEMRQAMIEEMRFWIREVGIDGFRCDVAYEVPEDFWKEARAALDDEESDIWMLAEDESKPWMLNDAFNANYGWSFHHLINQLAQGRQKPEAVFEYQERQEASYPGGSYPMHFITNHDENSWQGTVFERLGPANKAMALLTFTMPGMPLIYSGQEIGLDKRLEFFDHDPIQWTGGGSYTRFYQELNRLKQEHPALYAGSAGGTFVRIPNDNEEHILSFARTTGDDTVIILINCTNTDQAAALDLSGLEGTYHDLFHMQVPQGFEVFETMDVNLGPWGYQVFAK